MPSYGFRQEVETVRIIIPIQRPSMPPACGYREIHARMGRFAVGSPIAAPIPGARGTSVSIIGTFAGKDLPVTPAALAVGDVRGVPPRGKPV